MSLSKPNICRTDTLMSGSGAAGSVTAVIAPPWCESPNDPGRMQGTGGPQHVWPSMTPKSMNFGVSTHSIGEAPGGSHQADRMSGINLTESHHEAEAVAAVQVKLVGSPF